MPNSPRPSSFFKVYLADMSIPLGEFRTATCFPAYPELSEKGLVLFLFLVGLVFLGGRSDGSTGDVQQFPILLSSANLG